MTLKEGKSQANQLNVFFTQFAISLSNPKPGIITETTSNAEAQNGLCSFWQWGIPMFWSKYTFSVWVFERDLTCDLTSGLVPNVWLRQGFPWYISKGDGAAQSDFESTLTQVEHSAYLDWQCLCFSWPGHDRPVMHAIKQDDMLQDYRWCGGSSCAVLHAYFDCLTHKTVSLKRVFLQRKMSIGEWYMRTVKLHLPSWCRKHQLPGPLWDSAILQPPCYTY